MAPITPTKMILIGVGWFGFQFFWAFHSGPLPLFLRDFTDSKFNISLVISLAGLAGCIMPPLAGYGCAGPICARGARTERERILGSWRPPFLGQSPTDRRAAPLRREGSFRIDLTTQTGGRRFRAIGSAFTA